jgi:hypothetical protein
VLLLRLRLLLWQLPLLLLMVLRRCRHALVHVRLTPGKAGTRRGDLDMRVAAHGCNAGV